MTRVLLIHGAWHGAWAWDRVLPLLDGHEVTAPDLPGCGDDRASLSPAIDLECHVDAAMPAKPTVICGHSYGGVVARVIADRSPDNVLAVVLIEALWPESGQSAMDQLPGAGRARFEAMIADRGDGWRLPPPDAGVFDLPDAALRDGLNDKMSDHPAQTFRDPVAVTRPEPKGTYIIATDRNPQPYTETATRLAGQGWNVIETRGGHELPLTQPRLIANAIAAAV